MEGWIFLVGAAGLGVWGARHARPVGWLGWLLLGFGLWFFRDPRRSTPLAPEAVVAPADGVVSDIETVPAPDDPGVEVVRIGIFLSIFDVHVNRAAVAGRFTRVIEEAGAFHDARNPLAAEKNARCTWWLERTDGRTILLRQLTGAVARRIVRWKREGESVAVGERFGMIRFGSRTELYLPLDAVVLTAVGARVRGGETVLGTLPMS